MVDVGLLAEAVGEQSRLSRLYVVRAELLELDRANKRSEPGDELPVPQQRRLANRDRRCVIQPALKVLGSRHARGLNVDAVLEAVQELGLPLPTFARLGMPPDRFIAHGSRSGQLAECGYDATGIAATVQRLVERPEGFERDPTRRLRRRTLASR